MPLAFAELKSDTENEIQKGKHSYDNATHLYLKVKRSHALKSGHFKAGVLKVNYAIAWPRDYCTIVSGYKQPTYDELMFWQWSQCFMFSVLDESEKKLGQYDNML